MASFENKAFTSKIIRQLQSPEREEWQIYPGMLYLMKHKRLIWDEHRALFWVIPPEGFAQIAIWLMDAAMKFEPTPDWPEDIFLLIGEADEH